MRISSFVDAYLGYCKVTGKSITGIIHLVNQTPVDFSKLQNTIEITTYGSKFIAMRQCTEQVRELQEALKSMGIPIERTAWMLGDNQSVISLSTILASILKKGTRHLAITMSDPVLPMSGLNSVT